MTRKEAAQLLVELLFKYRGEKKYDMDVRKEYYEAVSVACGVLLIDDVLNGNPIPPQSTDFRDWSASKEV